MSEKYIELMPVIEGDDSMTGCDRETVQAVLSWLDRNPDQVPGRTITESEFREACEYEDQAHRASSPHTYAERVMFALGITVVPDPEPTNAEKLADDIREVDGGHNLGAGVLAERLASLGWTKAPGGDDER